MTERPILFSAPMVRAILDGRKTQTRRVVKLLGAEVVEEREAVGRLHLWPWSPQHDNWVACPYGAPGGRLWVKESIRRVGEPFGEERWCSSEFIADGTPTKADAWPWRNKALPSIHMPKGLCRITLEVTGVRVERLQAISELDAKAEGMDRDQTPVEEDDYEDPREVGYPLASDLARHEATKHRRWFRSLWESINGAGSWEANPWVWVVSFKRVTP